MPGPSSVDAEKTAQPLTRMEAALSRNPADSRQLEVYYQACVAASALERARTFLDELQRRTPGNHVIRRLRIAICLQQKDFRTAMGIIETLVAFSTPDAALIDSALSVRRRLGPLSMDAKTSKVASLSLCMIVKNEQAYLAPCLNSIKSIADEIIVLDTGSTDRSADIARIYGARVHDFKWRDDFAAARNDALEKAGGDWVLVLDADEIIAPADRPALQALVDRSDPHTDAHAFVTRNYTHRANGLQWQVNDRSYPQHEAGLGWYPTRKVRLFPRSPKIRFEFPVHEVVDRTVAAAGMTITPSPVPIHHYGHLNEARNQHKARRYFDLGYRKLEQMGNDRTALRELAVQAGQLDHWPQAIELWHRFLDLCPGNDEALANLGGACWQIGDHDRGVSYSQKAMRSNPELREAHYNLAINRLMQGRLDRAQARLQMLLKKYPDYTAARFMLAVALCLAGDGRRSRSLFNGLKQELPDQVLELAVEDLISKFDHRGLSRYAHRMSSFMGSQPGPASRAEK